MKITVATLTHGRRKMKAESEMVCTILEIAVQVLLYTTTYAAKTWIILCVSVCV